MSKEEENNNNNSDKKNIQHAMFYLIHSLLLSSKSPYFSQLPHLSTKHEITWYRISHLTGWFG